MSGDDDINHLTPESIEDYFRAGVETALILSQVMRAQLEVDPARQQLRLVCPAFGHAPDLTGYEQIAVERTNIVGQVGDWFRLTVGAENAHYEAYSFIESVLDQVRTGTMFGDAVPVALVGLEGLLATRARMSEAKEVGLIGELIVLKHAISELGESRAVSSWLGSLSEEHDFAFEVCDVEVKTTRAESRVHIIGSETQLQPTQGRSLFLLSIQITQSGVDTDAFSLSDLVEEIGATLGGSQGTFNAALVRSGWHQRAADLYRTRFRLRSVPAAYLVDTEFPAITRERLAAVVPSHGLVGAVSYRVDLTALQPSAGPPELESLVRRPDDA